MRKNKIGSLLKTPEKDFHPFRIVDSLVPLVDQHNNVIKEKVPRNLENKINKRNRLLKSFKRNPSIERKRIITNLNIEIKTNFFTSKNRQGQMLSALRY